MTESADYDVRVTRVRLERQDDALGIGAAAPRVSWITETDRANWRQAAYEIEATGDDGAAIWRSGRVESMESVFVPWGGAALRSRERGIIRVRVWGRDGSASTWSTGLPFEAGLLQAGDWTARFVGPVAADQVEPLAPLPMLRREFALSGEIRRARLYITSLGVYEAEINGRRVGDHVLAPGWTSYNHRLRYQTFDVTDMLGAGANAVCATLGEGWYRGRIGFGEGRRNIYGDRMGLIAQLEIAYADGRTESVVTDESWRWATGPTMSAGIYEGEAYDGRLERDGWSMPGYDDGGWAPVAPIAFDIGVLEAPVGPPVRRTQELAPVSVLATPSGKSVLDFGQNLVGRLRITVEGEAGTTITLRHAEVMEDGEICVRPLRGAQATDTYTLRGGGVETWEPRFTFHGFRYAEVTGWPGTLGPDAVRAVVCHSDMERTGWFECSDGEVNRLHENIVWSMRGNFLDVPTDCPQRNERLGWTGDINVFSPTAAFLFDCDGFLASWLRDLAAEQYEDGTVPFVIPDAAPMRSVPTACWGDAAVIVPWVLYERFGDGRALADQYDSMRRWVDLVAELCGETRLWDAGFQFGDWLDPAAPPDRPRDALTDTHLVATACYAQSLDVIAGTATLLGHAEDVSRYAALGGEVRDAFAREYVTPSGRLAADTQTAYALALQYGLLPTEAQRAHAADRLGKLVHQNGYRIGTGFVGTPLVCDALSGAEKTDAAYRMLLERACPSWLFPVTMGATTIWERWDSLLPDGSVNPGEMTSFNHYALGAIGDWMHRTTAGLAALEAGYRKIAIAPRPGGGLTHAWARHRTPYGMAECGWRDDGGRITVRAVIPANVTAVVNLPGGAPFEVGSGVHEWVIDS